MLNAVTNAISSAISNITSVATNNNNNTNSSNNVNIVDRSEFYKLLTKQLIDDGFNDIAKTLANTLNNNNNINNQQSIDINQLQSIPSNALFNALQNALANNTNNNTNNINQILNTPNTPTFDNTNASNSTNDNTNTTKKRKLDIDVISSESKDKTNINTTNVSESEDNIQYNTKQFPPYETIFITSHKESCKALSFNNDGTMLITGSNDSSIKLMDTNLILLNTTSDNKESTKPVLRTLYDHDLSITDLSFHPYQPLFISSSKDCTIKIWNYTSNNNRKAFKIFQDLSPINQAQFHPSGDYILSCGLTTHFHRIIDSLTLQQYISSDHTEYGHTARINMARWNETGSMFTTASKDGTVKIWDTHNNTIISTIQAHSGMDCTSAIFSPNSNYLLTAGKDNTVKLYDVSTCKIVQTYSGIVHSRHPSVAIFDKTGQFILTSDENNNNIIIFDVKSGEISRKIISGHTKTIKSLAFNPHENMFVSCSDDSRCRVWYDKYIFN